MRQSILVVIVLAGCAACATLWAEAEEKRAPGIGDRVIVETTSGRRLRGEIDRTTNVHALALSGREPGIVIVSRIPWSDVLSLRKAEAADALPTVDETEQRPVDPPSLARRSPARVKSLAVHAVAANWDDDADLDGLQLFVVPLSAQGEVLPVAGSLTVHFAVERSALTWRGASRTESESWSQSIQAGEFGPQGLIVQLPFRRLRPERDRELSHWGRVSVRLSIPGQGAFDARSEAVLLQPPGTLPSGLFAR